MKILKLRLNEEDEAALRAYSRAVRDLLKVNITDAEVVRRMLRQASCAGRSSDTQPMLPLKRRFSDRPPSNS